MYKLWIWLLAAGICGGQTCSLNVAGQNQKRRVSGPVNTECPDLFHTSPFGNWGVTSNYGQKRDSRQFDGWCHNTFVCDNNGACRTECRSEWYQWNSCTDHPLYRAPNATFYNDGDGRLQVTATGINTHGTRTVEMPVACPGDTDADGISDTGGCSLITTHDPGRNFMSLYELDPATGDELVQTLYFPDTVVALNCGPLGCGPAASEWKQPNGYDSPSSPPRAYAELRTLVNSGVFLDRNNACALSTAAAAAVSGATFRQGALAPESIASVFGSGFTAGPDSARTRPLPQSLGGVTVTVTDSIGTTRPAGLFYVSVSQINFEMPPALAPGRATVQVNRGTNIRWRSTVVLENVAPALFSANASGSGVAAALFTRVAPDGSQQVETVFECTELECLPKEIDLASGPVYLTLFGTGFRHGSRTQVLIGGVQAAVLYSGRQPEYIGLDQVNVELPSSLRGRGDVYVAIAVDGHISNALLLRLK